MTAAVSPRLIVNPEPKGNKLDIKVSGGCTAGIGIGIKKKKKISKKRHAITRQSSFV